MRSPKYLEVKMKLVLTIFAVIFLSPVAFATPLLPLSCKSPLTATGTCPTDQYACIPGKSGLLIATPESGWKLWESLAPSDLIRAWQDNITVGNACTGSRISIPKSSAFAEPAGDPPISLFSVTIRWEAPTLDSVNQPLDPTSIIGYRLQWRLAAVAQTTELKLPAQPLSFTLQIPREKACFYLQTEDKFSLSDSSPEVCVDPGVIKPGIPQNVTVEFGAGK